MLHDIDHRLSFKGLLSFKRGFPGSSDGKVSACNVGDLDSIPGLGRSPGEENGKPLQYSCLENSMMEEPDRQPGRSVGSQRVRHNRAVSLVHWSFIKIAIQEERWGRHTGTAIDDQGIHIP